MYGVQYRMRDVTLRPGEMLVLAPSSLWRRAVGMSSSSVNTPLNPLRQQVKFAITFMYFSGAGLR